MGKFVSLDNLERYNTNIKEYIKDTTIYTNIHLNTSITLTEGDVLDSKDIEQLTNLASDIVSEVETVSEGNDSLMVQKSVGVSIDGDFILSNYGNIEVYYNSNKEISLIILYCFFGTIELHLDINVDGASSTGSYSFLDNTIEWLYGATLTIPMYYSDNNYSIGDVVRFPDGRLYKCIRDIVGPKQFDNNDWTQISLLDYLADKINGAALNGTN